MASDVLSSGPDLPQLTSHDVLTCLLLKVVTQLQLHGAVWMSWGGGGGGGGGGKGVISMHLCHL